MSVTAGAAKTSGRLEALLQRAFETVRGHGGFLLVTVGATIASFSAIPNAWWLAIPGALLVIGGIVLHVKLKPSYSELLRQASQDEARAKETAASLQSALESILRRVAAHCGINETHQRISIYCHVGNEFVMLARHSVSTRLRGSGRGRYPAGKGVIGEAWDIGESLRRDWPADRTVRSA